MTYFAYTSLYLRIKWFQTVVTNIKIKWWFSLSNAGKFLISAQRTPLWKRTPQLRLKCQQEQHRKGSETVDPRLLCERTNNINSSKKKKNLWVFLLIYIDRHIFPSHSSIYWASTICQPFYKSLGDRIVNTTEWVGLCCPHKSHILREKKKQAKTPREWTR